MVETSNLYKGYQTVVPSKIRKKLNLDLNHVLEWNINEKGTNIAYFTFDGEPKNDFDIILHISNHDGKNPVDDELKEFAWSRMILCPVGCERPVFCENSKNRRTVFGKEFESTCQSPLAFFTPDANQLKKVQNLMLMFY
jgi:bifunctional DNA-binding transcriptional regulator/antitoxin component of YhaV-PrlF toxin-antitoxin module